MSINQSVGNINHWQHFLSYKMNTHFVAASSAVFFSLAKKVTIQKNYSFLHLLSELLLKLTFKTWILLVSRISRKRNIKKPNHQAEQKEVICQGIQKHRKKHTYIRQTEEDFPKRRFWEILSGVSHFLLNIHLHTVYTALKQLHYYYFLANTDKHIFRRSAFDIV